MDIRSLEIIAAGAVLIFMMIFIFVFLIQADGYQGKGKRRIFIFFILWAALTTGLLFLYNAEKQSQDITAEVIKTEQDRQRDLTWRELIFIYPREARTPIPPADRD